MKKILLATSILAATTGYAAAEVSLTGDARMGVVFDGEDVQFSERARVRFNLSGQTDTGLEFGAAFRAHEANDSQTGGFASDVEDRESTVWISGAFGQLEMGDVASAAEEAIGDLDGVGFSGLNDYSDIPYINGDGSTAIEQGPGALYSYTMSGFEFHLSMTDGNLGYGSDEDSDERTTAYAVAVAYQGDNYKVGLGYLDNGEYDENDGNYGGSQVILSGETDVAGFAVKAYYASFDGVLDELDGYGSDVDPELDHTIGLGVSYTFGATTVRGFARRDDLDNEVNGDDKLDTFGIGAIYDLGGGATINGGVVNTDRYTDEDGDGETLADIGIKLAF
ncbi:porin [Falsirhodobacter algicola]|uniref:Porin n=1 Tax=Falsirhodobacter algicola TaxID=2692330 RepID=A0A8J8MUF4_9RHOB|nr:porin [Falsirhodobacter algicola]QUS36488.1 porin [Falsirhodobacter algicola]